MTRRWAALLAVVLVATGCGGADERSSSPADWSCTGMPPATGRDGPVAIPRPISPEGPATSWVAEYWGAEATLAEGGLCVVSETTLGTFALTGVVVDADVPVRGARVTLEPVPSTGITHEALTDVNGAFAFVNLPVRGGRMCLRETITRPGSFSWVDVDWVSPGEYEQSIEVGLPRGPIGRFCSQSS